MILGILLWFNYILFRWRYMNLQWLNTMNFWVSLEIILPSMLWLSEVDRSRFILEYLCFLFTMYGVVITMGTKWISIRKQWWECYDLDTEMICCREMLRQLITYWMKKVGLWLLHFFHMEFLHDAWILLLRWFIISVAACRLMPDFLDHIITTVVGSYLKLHNP